MVWVVFKSAEQEVVEWLTKKEPERGCANDMGMDGKGHITYAYVEILGTAKGLQCATICTFYTECVLCVDPCTNFSCQIFLNDCNL